MVCVFFKILVFVQCQQVLSGPCLSIGHQLRCLLPLHPVSMSRNRSCADSHKSFKNACFQQRPHRQHPLRPDSEGFVVLARTGSPRGLNWSCPGFTRTGSPRDLNESCPGFMAPSGHLSQVKDLVLTCFSQI